MIGGLADKEAVWPLFMDPDREAYLRETTGHMILLKQFTRLCVTAGVFKEKATTERLSEYMEPGLEAFLVLTYVNNYCPWMKKWEAMKKAAETGVAESLPDDDISEYTEDRLFTNSPKGVGKYKGWTPEGRALHRRMKAIIQRHRSDNKEFGNVLEDLLIQEFTEGGAPVANQMPEMEEDGAEDTDDFFIKHGHEAHRLVHKNTVVVEI